MHVQGEGDMSGRGRVIGRASLESRNLSWAACVSTFLYLTCIPKGTGLVFFLVNTYWKTSRSI